MLEKSKVRSHSYRRCFPFHFTDFSFGFLCKDALNWCVGLVFYIFCGISRMTQCYIKAVLKLKEVIDFLVCEWPHYCKNKSYHWLFVGVWWETWKKVIYSKVYIFKGIYIQSLKHQSEVACGKNLNNYRKGNYAVFLFLWTCSTNWM